MKSVLRPELTTYAAGTCSLGSYIAVYHLGVLHFLGFGPEAPEEAYAIYPGGHPETDKALLADLDTMLAGKSVKILYGFTGTLFQMNVWHALCEIPYGTTITYKELAQRVGKPTAIRAVANAVGANPISLLIPCHRVIGSDGTLHGYRWGVGVKKMLLAREKAKAAIASAASGELVH